MKITNKTKWSTDDLRAIISAALSARGVPSTGLAVEVVPSKQWITGRAVLGKMRDAHVPLREYHLLERRADGSVIVPKKMHYGHWMILRLPNPVRIAEHVETEEAKAHIASKRFLRFARVVEHEVAHLQGLTHPMMSEALYECTQDVSGWLGELKLNPAPEEVCDKAAARADRLGHAREKLKLATTREKRATTLRKKWERRVRALERAGGES